MTDARELMQKLIRGTASHGDVVAHNSEVLGKPSQASETTDAPDYSGKPESASHVALKTQGMSATEKAAYLANHREHVRSYNAAFERDMVAWSHEYAKEHNVTVKVARAAVEKERLELADQIQREKQREKEARLSQQIAEHDDGAVSRQKAFLESRAKGTSAPGDRVTFNQDGSVADVSTDPLTKFQRMRESAGYRKLMGWDW